MRGYVRDGRHPVSMQDATGEEIERVDLTGSQFLVAEVREHTFILKTWRGLRLEYLQDDILLLSAGPVTLLEIAGGLNAGGIG